MSGDGILLAAAADLPYAQMYLMCVTDKAGNFNCNDPRQIFGLLSSEMVELYGKRAITVEGDSAYIAGELPCDIAWTQPVYDAIANPFNENKLKSIISGFNAVYTQKTIRQTMTLPYDELARRDLVRPKKSLLEKYLRYVPNGEVVRYLHDAIRDQITSSHPTNARLASMAYILHIAKQFKPIYGMKEARSLDSLMRDFPDRMNGEQAKGEFEQTHKVVKACFYAGSVFGFM